VILDAGFLILVAIPAEESTIIAKYEILKTKH